MAFSCDSAGLSGVNSVQAVEQRNSTKIEMGLTKQGSENEKKSREKPLFAFLKSSLTEDLITFECARTVDSNVWTMGNNSFLRVILSLLVF